MSTRQRRRRLERRGRPRRANARRRQTTVAGRAAPPDEGTPQLRQKKRQVTRRENLELNGAAALYGNGHITGEQYDSLSLIMLWLQRLQRGWGGLGGVTGLWHSILGAAVPTGFVRPQNAMAAGLADGARHALERACRRLDGSRALVVALAEGRTPPIVLRALDNRLTRRDKVELERLRVGLDSVAGRRQQAVRV